MLHNCYVNTGQFNQKSILAICYAISSTSGSEPGAGWAVVRAHLSLGVKVSVVTRRECAEELEKQADFPVNNLEIISMDYGKIATKLLQRTPLQIRYLYWNFYVRSKLRHKNFSKFDVVHHVTYSGDWNPTLIHFLSRKVSTLWGPVGGAQKVPECFSRHFEIKNRIRNWSHSYFGDLARFLLRFLIRRNGTIVLAANSATKKCFEKVTKVVVCQNVSFPPISITQEFDSELDSNFYFGAGRLLYWKNWETPIRAMSQIENKLLLIAGEGPHLKKLEQLILDLDLQARVTLLGKVDRQEVLRLMTRSKGFVFPSLRDSASWALGEAIHLGVPVIAYDLPGNRCLSERGDVKLVPLLKNPQLEYTNAMLDVGKKKKIVAGSQCECVLSETLETRIYPIIFHRSK